MKTRLVAALSISVILLRSTIVAAEPAKDGVYLAVEGNLVFVITLDHRIPGGDSLDMYHLKDGEWKFAESLGLRRNGDKITSIGTTVGVETTSGPGYSTQRLIQTEQFFVSLKDAPTKINRVYSLIHALNRN